MHHRTQQILLISVLRLTHPARRFAAS
jgi:hypothetical protein